MRGRQFVESVVKVGRQRGVPVRIDKKRGKGSHLMLHYGDRKTSLKDRRKELGPGLLAAMLRQLGLTDRDLL